MRNYLVQKVQDANIYAVGYIEQPDPMDPEMGTEPRWVAVQDFKAEDHGDSLEAAEQAANDYAGQLNNTTE